ncbi:hypothetical protein ASZ90_015026 [hydrocarbon metagenome]|uniref:Uncharacterized protein n=1 Tax=hydrocarbon metagenome TaxID=938273 RepID=A0A0W8F3C6_9ZZZZ
MHELPDDLIEDGTRGLMEAASRLGLTVRKMPKFIDPVECCRDGRCVAGPEYRSTVSLDSGPHP